MKCAIEGCRSLAAHRSWCGKHYQRWWKHGNPETLKKNPNGTGSIDHEGYVIRTVDGSHKREHIDVAERALGKPLPFGAIVHHVDENRSNNDPSNLVICPSRAYHALIHRRMRALAACGNPSWLKCSICGTYDAPENLAVNAKWSVARHRACMTRVARERSIRGNLK